MLGRRLAIFAAALFALAAADDASSAPTVTPATKEPSPRPSAAVTASPTDAATAPASAAPAAAPAADAEPSAAPTAMIPAPTTGEPAAAPTTAAPTTAAPTDREPSSSPTTSAPTSAPPSTSPTTSTPTVAPTPNRTAAPTRAPTLAPTTSSPTVSPTSVGDVWIGSSLAMACVSPAVADDAAVDPRSHFFGAVVEAAIAPLLGRHAPANKTAPLAVFVVGARNESNVVVVSYDAAVSAVIADGAVDAVLADFVAAATAAATGGGLRRAFEAAATAEPWSQCVVEDAATVALVARSTAALDRADLGSRDAPPADSDGGGGGDGTSVEDILLVAGGFVVLVAVVAGGWSYSSKARARLERQERAQQMWDAARAGDAARQRTPPSARGRYDDSEVEMAPVGRPDRLPGRSARRNLGAAFRRSSREEPPRPSWKNPIREGDVV